MVSLAAQALVGVAMLDSFYPPGRRWFHAHHGAGGIFASVPVARARAFAVPGRRPPSAPRGAAGCFALQPLAWLGACTAGSAGRVVGCDGDPIHPVGLGRLAGSVATRLVPGPALGVEDWIAPSAALVRACPPVVALVLTVIRSTGLASRKPARSFVGCSLLATRWVPCGCGQHASGLRYATPPAVFPKSPHRRASRSPQHQACAWPTPQ